jgi:hypothetical protein
MSAPQTAGSVGVNQLMPWLGGSGGGALGAAMGGPSGAGMGAAAGMIAGQTIPPAARSLLLSPLYQNVFANYAPISSAPLLSQSLANPAIGGQIDPLLQGILQR